MLMVLSLTFSLSSCLSYAIDNFSGKYRNTFEKDATRESIRKDIGEPSYSYDKRLGGLSRRYIDGMEGVVSYDEFRVKGKIHHDGDGYFRFLTAFYTLGISELVVVPATVVHVINASDEKHVIYVYYDADGKYVNHAIYRPEQVTED